MWRKIMQNHPFFDAKSCKIKNRGYFAWLCIFCQKDGWFCMILYDCASYMRWFCITKCDFVWFSIKNGWFCIFCQKKWLILHDFVWFCILVTAFTLWVDKRSLKMPKMVNFWRVFETPKLAVKQCYQTGQFWCDKNWWKMPKLKNSNTIFWVII